MRSMLLGIRCRDETEVFKITSSEAELKAHGELNHFRQMKEKAQQMSFHRLQTNEYEIKYCG